jgi:hypothetical protein
MIVGYFHVKCIAVFPEKAYPPLVIDGNGMQAGTISRQCMKAVDGRNLQVVEAGRQAYIFQTTNRLADDIRRQAPRLTGEVELLRMLVGEYFDHITSLICHVMRVKSTDNHVGTILNSMLN